MSDSGFYIRSFHSPRRVKASLWLFLFTKKAQSSQSDILCALCAFLMFCKIIYIRLFIFPTDNLLFLPVLPVMLFPLFSSLQGKLHHILR